MTGMAGATPRPIPSPLLFEAKTAFESTAFVAGEQ
jgi:hypothetical protein